MTVSDLIDYLNQFDGDTLVLLDEDAVREAPEHVFTELYIVLDRLDYSIEAPTEEESE